MAARGARAASRAGAAHRRADESGRGRSRRTGPTYGVPARTAAIGLGRRPQCADRLSLGRGRSPTTLRKYAAELVALAPDVILADGASPHGRIATGAPRTVPIVFATVTDPVGAGFVESLARPGGNATGFTSFEYAIAAKWLELLKEIAPRVTRAAVLRDPTIAAGIGQFAAIQAVATDRDGVERDRPARCRRRSSTTSRNLRAARTAG